MYFITQDMQMQYQLHQAFIVGTKSPMNRSRQTNGLFHAPHHERIEHRIITPG